MKILTFIAALFLAGSANAQIITPGQQQFDGVTLPGGKSAGRFYYPYLTTANPSGAALGAANRLYASPMYVGASSVLKTLSFDITTGNASAWNARMCVYADNGSGAPGVLQADSGTVAIASGSVTGIQTAALSGGGVSVGPGWVWVAFMADSASESVMSWAGSIGTTGGPITNLLGASSASAAFGGGAANAVYSAQTFGACPATFGTVTYNTGTNAPFIVAGF